jgi:hypothetical protein
MNILPESATLQEIVDLISKTNEADTSLRDFGDVLTENISYICKGYELTDEDSEFIVYSFLGLEEQGNSKTLQNASKAQKIINKKGK